MTDKVQANCSTRHMQDVEIQPYEKALAFSIKDVVAEICLTDASILISYICNNLHANIEDLIDSSTELFFEEGTLLYGHAADVDFEWGKTPAVILDMEFIHPSVTVFFKLVLHGFYVGVSINRILLSEKTGDPALDIKRFQEALAESRLAPLKRDL